MSFFSGHQTEKEELNIIERLVDNERLMIKIIEKLLSKGQNLPTATQLTATYNLVTPKGDIIFVNNKKSTMPNTVTVLDGQNVVPGQLIPLAADGVTVEPISTLNAGSEVYTSSDTTIATVGATNTAEGAFTVTRVPGAKGNVTISYTAVNTAGTTISGSDNFVFQGPSTGLASSLTASYGTPTA